MGPSRLEDVSGRKLLSRADKPPPDEDGVSPPGVVAPELGRERLRGGRRMLDDDGGTRPSDTARCGFESRCLNDELDVEDLLCLLVGGISDFESAIEEAAHGVSPAVRFLVHSLPSTIPSPPMPKRSKCKYVFRTYSPSESCGAVHDSVAFASFDDEEASGGALDGEVVETG